MGHLSKLALASIQKDARADPATMKRNKVLAGLAEQQKVLSARLEGKEYEVPIKRWRSTIDGKREQFDTVKRVRAWFFELNGGWYVQCKLGNKPLVLDGKNNNSVFCEDLAGVSDVLDAFEAALKAKELDQAIGVASIRKVAGTIRTSRSSS